MSEHAEQAALFKLAAMNEARFPALRLLHAVQNWAGVKSPREGARRKREGVRAGVPDVHLPVPRGGYASLYIEMKRYRPRQTKTLGLRWDKEKPTADQLEWHEALREEGNAVVVAWSAAEAWEYIEDYMTGMLHETKQGRNLHQPRRET